MNEQKFLDPNLSAVSGKVLTLQLDGQDVFKIKFTAERGRLIAFHSDDPNGEDYGEEEFTTMESATRYTISELSRFLQTSAFVEFIWKTALEAYQRGEKHRIAQLDVVTGHDDWKGLDADDIGEAGTAVLQALLSITGLHSMNEALWKHLWDFFEEF